ncbi:transketolase [Occallatibacter riparius]|uniref:Transketolase n=1 Tax=Occallatibacter riparius TaxID=1002689 RepID=A0A9J7BUP7_9BACT|nr:transketolase [Occallatibacter riparius]UWZ85482.1 transketolase [Occallatibacter riparius]
MTTSPATLSLDQLSIDTLRLLAVDTVQKANSGHPGAPLGCAPIAYLLYHKLMKHNPTHWKWSDRDRFVLSNGHASALLYSTLFLTGYPDMTLDQLKSFRQWHSKTPGHPESGEATGVEVTTGPLGQGFGMAVGMAIAEKHMAAVYNKPGFNIVDHHTYVLCGDGDLMEGISHEAASLAGTLQLGKLIVLYDDNLISLDGPTEWSYTEDVLKRFDAYHWHTSRVADGNDLAGIEKAIEEAKAVTDKPSLIAVRTIIGYGSPKAGTNAVHGEALGAANVAATKKFFGFPEDQSFYVPDEALKNWRQAVDRGKQAEADWNKLFDAYAKENPELAEQFKRSVVNKRKAGWEKALPTFGTEKKIATRNAGNQVMNAIANEVPELFGGAADLTASTKTIFKNSPHFAADPAGRNVFFGVREFGMCAAVNGMAAHEGLVPYGSTFFCFSDYCKPAIRLAALSRAHSIFVFTHDSIALGEDGPTHQPIEHLMMLRAVPDLTDYRPADANETAACWRLVLERNGAAFMALSRQDLPVIDAAKVDVYGGVSKGAYVLEDAANPQVILIGTGAEVWPCVEAKKLLEQEGIAARVVSMPSWEIYDEQSAEYKSSVLTRGVPKLAVEAGSPLGWWKYVGETGGVVGLDRFGASAPGPIALEKLGFSAANVAEQAKKVVKGRG